MSCLGCSASAVATVTYVVIHSEVFQMLEEMIRQDAINAINFIDQWIEKQISENDFSKLNQLKTKAMNAAIMSKNTSGSSGLLSLPASPRFIDSSDEKTVQSIPIQPN